MSDFVKESGMTAMPAPTSKSARSRESIPENFIPDSDDATDDTTIDVSHSLSNCWQKLIHPLLRRLDQHLDSRLVGTIDDLIRAIVQHRHRSCGLLLSELGAYICGPDHAPAGTKRLSNLFRSEKWKSEEVDEHLWSHAIGVWEEMARHQQEALLLWDESVLEKPESQHIEGLSPVRSSKAKRLSRIRKGFYRPPGPPVFVPGLPWLAVLLIGYSGPPTMAAMRWWGTRQPASSQPASSSSSKSPPDSPPVWLRHGREVALQLLEQCCQTFELGVIHVFDRGYAGAPWLHALEEHNARFILRWTKHYQLQNADGIKEAAWKLLRGKRCTSHRLLRDGRHQQQRKVGLKTLQVFHPSYGHGLVPLSLVVASRGQGQEPWYLLTNEAIHDEDEAWNIVMAYARRWQIEACFRFNKTELALESPRLWNWERRRKLLMVVTLVYALLLALLQLPESWKLALLRKWCHRTGKRSRDTSTPLYRIRAALAALFTQSPPQIIDYKNSG